jgi:uncharacterized protein YjeT (DUF2065 family)
MTWGIILIIFGVVYIVKPDIYRRWIWKETDFLQRKLTPKQYIQMMRALGIVFVMLGIFLQFIWPRLYGQR